MNTKITYNRMMRSGLFPYKITFRRTIYAYAYVFILIAIRFVTYQITSLLYHMISYDIMLNHVMLFISCCIMSYHMHINIYIWRFGDQNWHYIWIQMSQLCVPNYVLIYYDCPLRPVHNKFKTIEDQGNGIIVQFILSFSQPILII